MTTVMLRSYGIALVLVMLCLSGMPCAQGQDFVATTGNMTTARENYTATLLNNGLVLLTGGRVNGSTDESGIATAELFNPATGTFTATGSMHYARWGHTATLLANGQVLIAGGIEKTYTPLAAAELYNPATGTFAYTGLMTTPRSSHSAVLLSTGKVLVAGGADQTTSKPPSTLATAELYDPSTGKFTATGLMKQAREVFTATVLNSGNVLIAGGVDWVTTSFLANAEIYNVASGSFSLTGSMPVGRFEHTATLLSNGNVLVAGGQNPTAGTYLSSACVYNASTGVFTATANLNFARFSHTATLLNNGLVLVAGGAGSESTVSSTAELYDPVAGTFTQTGNLLAPTAGATATFLSNVQGEVLIAGGDGSSGPTTFAQLYEGPGTGYTGYAYPKYIVLSVQYAPPGMSSTVDYGTSTNVGTSNSAMNSFSSGVTQSVTVGFKTDSIFGLTPSGGISETESTTNSQEQDTTSSVAFNKLSTLDQIVKGPATNSIGLDHTQDTVTIWLNPAVQLTALTTASKPALQLNNYFYDTRDGLGTGPMDTITLSVEQLLNFSLIKNQNQINQLMRAWSPNLADGSSPGLTSTDLAHIAAADPYSSTSYSPTFQVYADGTCSTDGRYCKSTNADIQYSSPAEGGQGGTTKYMEGYTATATEGQSVKSTYSTGFTLEIDASGGFLADFTADLKTTNTLTWINQWSTQTSQTSGQSVTTSITSPSYSDNYLGMTEFEVYQDNLYGTLMFLPVPYPGFILGSTPSSQTVTAGGSTTFNVTTTITDGFSGNVALSVASGLPTGATATFSPSTIAAGGSSVLTVNTTSATPPGTYTLTLDAKYSTDLPHSIQVTLVVAAQPNFTIACSPGSQTVTAGGGTSYNCSQTALNGFSGTTTLSVPSLPSGVGVTFGPTSVTGSGSFTATVTTSSSTPAGGYTLAITGTSGSLKNSASVTLVVNAAIANFTMSITPNSLGVAAGGKGVYTVSTTAVNGFNGAVTLTLAGLPSGASGVFSPTSITGSGSSTLTVTTSTTTPVGTSTLTITGTAGTLVHTTTATITVDAP
jgi:hypothetical protein